MLTIRSQILHFIRNRTGGIERDPVLVFGNQKSGTTAITALLALMTENQYSSDIFFRLKKDNMTAIWRKELKWKDFVYAHRAFFRSKIIKEPSFTLLMPEVLEFYPTAKALFIVRHPLENIRSILNRLKIQPKSKDWGYGAMPREWQNILTGLHVPNSGENYMENLSLRWLRCVELYERSKNRLQLVKYEAFNSDKASELKSICAALGLEVRKAVEPHCDTQFQPKGQEVKDFKEFLGADNYSIVRKICSPAAKQFGYEFES